MILAILSHNQQKWHFKEWHYGLSRECTFCLYFILVQSHASQPTITRLASGWFRSLIHKFSIFYWPTSKNDRENTFFCFKVNQKIIFRKTKFHKKNILFNHFWHAQTTKTTTNETKTIQDYLGSSSVHKTTCSHQLGSSLQLMNYFQ